MVIYICMILICMCRDYKRDVHLSEQYCRKDSSNTKKSLINDENVKDI